MLKDEYPVVIANLLEIPPMAGKAGPWMSAEGTVIVEWLLAVGEVLDIPYQGEKTRMMRALIESVGMTWDEVSMSSKRSLSGGGGNISIPAFQALLEGLRRLPERRSQALRAEAAPYAVESPGRKEDMTVLRAIRDRAGQPEFRAKLLRIYSGKCAVTACDAAPALEAAHVVPYGLGGTYKAENGLLLRADIHTLFDKGLLAFSDRRQIVLHPNLDRTSYAELEGADLSEPSPRNLRVPTNVLLRHRERAGI